MPESIAVADFIQQTWDDYKSPTTSTFDKNMGKCRCTVSQIEEDLDTDRSELTKLKKSVRALYNSTNKHAQNEKDISENLMRMSKMSTNSHKNINSALHEFSKVTKALGSLIEDLAKSLYNSLQFPVETMLKGDIKEVKGDLRKPFDKSWRDYESKFSKLEKEAKKKANEAGLYRGDLSGSEVAEDMEKERKIFQLQLCMYLLKVNEIKTKKGVDLLQCLVEYYKAVKLFFEKGKDEVEKHQGFVNDLGQQLKDIKQAQSQERSQLQELQTALKNSMSGYKEPSSNTPSTAPGYSLHQLQGNKIHGSEKDGYLLKKSEGMLKKIWQKRKCWIKDGIMSISHSDETKPPVKLNLLTCQVKLVSEDPGKKCFDLVSSHGNRTYHFQADEEKEMEQWISVLSNAKEEVLLKAFKDSGASTTMNESVGELTRSIIDRIEKLPGNKMLPITFIVTFTRWISVLSNAKEEVLLKAFKDSGASTTMNESVRELTRSIIDRIEKLPGNKMCCDCGAPDPKWLSTNLGILICLECCGIHRNLGVHISRTQSLEIDQLGTSQLLLARVIGNDNFNEVLEAKLGDRIKKPKPNSPMEEREEFIKAKYIHHKFTIQTCSDTTELQQDLQAAIHQRDIQSLIQVYAEGLDLMAVLPESPIDETALHLAIAQEDGTSLPIVDFIVQNSSLNSLGRQTRDGNTCLHVCAMLNKPECMKCLLRIKPDIANLKNSQGLTALDIAEERSYQLCAALLKEAIAGKKDVFENINIEWDLMTEDGPEYSDDELDIIDNMKKPRSRPSSIVAIEGSPRERSESESGSRIPTKPRKHHLTHPTRFRNSIRNIPGYMSHSSQSLPNATSQKSPDNPPLPPRGLKKPPHPLSIANLNNNNNNSQTAPMHTRTTSDPESEIPYVLHRRTPSEPPPRPSPFDNRNTIHIPMNNLPPKPLIDSDKPAVPPRPRTASATEETRPLTTYTDPSVPDSDVPPPIPAPRKPKKPNFRRCEALYDCDADNEDELTFREGETIILLREEEEEWWEGEIEGQPNRRGLFPISFVKPLPD